MPNENDKIYLDYAATTPVDKEVSKAMAPYFSNRFGNPSSAHSFGQEAVAVVDRSREKIAKLLNCNFSEIIFTGSATESNNLAIKGLISKLPARLRYDEVVAGGRVSSSNIHIISTNIEHESVLEPLRELEKSGHEITYLKVDKNGIIIVSDLEKNIKRNTALISIIYANNEIGTIQPIKEIGKLLEKINQKRKELGIGRIYFHTDAVQALNYLECRPDWLKANLMTFSGHKIYGPKGIGGLYVRKNIHLSPIILGGGQEFGLRSGTLNVPYIAGFAKAVELSVKNRESQYKRTLNLRNKMLNYIIKNNANVKLNGSFNDRLPNNLNIRFSGIDNEALLIALDQAGLAISAGSACSSGATAASHVLIAIGLTEKQAKESIRITLGKDTSEEEIKMAAEIINKTVKKLSSFA